eukprot:2268484-Prymnesium_polylepis.1
MCDSSSDEAVRYRRACSSEHSQLSGDLSRWYGRRAAVIEYAGRSRWGLGHVLPAVLQAHALCRQLRRYCYVRMYDMDVGHVFGFANGMRWEPTSSELQRYDSHNVTNHTACALTGLAAAWSGGAETPLGPAAALRRLRSDPAALLHIRCEGRIPFVDKSARMLPTLARDERAAEVGASRRRLTRCFCRFVTEPLFACDARRAAARVVYHLRTGYADVPNHDLRLFSRRSFWPAAHLGFAPNASWLRAREERARWLKLGCPALTAESLRATRVISDSPALARLGSTDAKTRRLWTSTRSWGGSLSDTTKAARDMVCLGGLSERLFTSRTSAYTVPLVARSFCVREVLSVDDAPSTCTEFNRLFPRDLYTHSSTPAKYAKSQAALPAWHPCKAAPAAQCRARFLAATFE